VRQKVGLVMAYYDNPAMLRLQMSTWLSYSVEAKNRFQFIIVDDCSPESPAQTVVLEQWGSHRPLDFMVFKVHVDRPWGQDGARNIGMKQTEAMWNLMTDMDHVLTKNNADRMMQFVDDIAVRGNYYMPGRCRTTGEPYHSHPNSFLFSKIDFWDINGYDEDFVGFYGSDGNFRKCARGYGLHEILISDSFKLMLHGTHDVVDCNTRRYSRKEGPLWAATNKYLNDKRTGGPYRPGNPFRLPYGRVM
jgi:glycosyl transferase family 2